MLPLRSFRQSSGYCGPACLKMVLEYYGKHVSERKLAHLSGCTQARGVNADGLKHAAQNLGFSANIKDNSELRDLKRYVMDKGIPIIVHWYFGDWGHFSVVVHVDARHIYLQDPELGRLQKIRTDVFRRLWFGFRDSGNIRSRKDLFIRRMIVISPAARFK